MSIEVLFKQVEMHKNQNQPTEKKPNNNKKICYPSPQKPC